MRIRSLPLILLLSLIAVPALADDVYLVNGRKFEGVIAETVGSQVRIQMQGGILSLPTSQVLRVETGESSLAEYLRRKEALKKNPSARAADWLALAQWTQGKQLDQATRESAVMAASLDPKLPGLKPILGGFGYVLDEEIGRWILYSDAMRRRGFVLANGEWVTREEYAATVRAYEEENARRRAAREQQARDARQERLVALTELSLVRDLTQSALAPQQPVYPPAYSVPFYSVPVIVVPGGAWGHGNWRSPNKPDPRGFTHVPGSLIPGNDFPPSAGSN
ncbi:MAG TPA: hypothetical protein VNM67_25460 [Thermoanaerobaculia bacterium]|nr:hypothetical protein [Thermoanaerobaculia bacterium]